MSFEIGTATDHTDLFDKLRTFLKSSSAGPGWTELVYDGATPRMFFEAPGLSGTEEIHIGFRLTADVPSDSFALQGWMAKAYNAALDMQSQPGDSGNRYHPIWDTSIPYWFIANGQRVIIVTKVSTVYTASYIGKFFPYGTPGEYPQPYYVGMPAGSNTRWSTVSHDIRNFFDPGIHPRVLHPSGEWFSGGNSFNSSGNEGTSTTSSLYIWPYNCNVQNSADRDRWRQMRDNLDGSYSLFPLRLMCDTPQLDYLGELDGAYAVSGHSQASEDIHDIGGIDHLVVQDISRTVRHNYAAIKLE